MDRPVPFGTISTTIYRDICPPEHCSGVLHALLLARLPSCVVSRCIEELRIGVGGADNTPGQYL
jgi:hypothetical protein